MRWIKKGWFGRIKEYAIGNLLGPIHITVDQQLIDLANRALDEHAIDRAMKSTGANCRRGADLWEKVLQRAEEAMS